MKKQKTKTGLAPWEKKLRHWDNQINEWFYSKGSSGDSSASSTYGCKISLPDGDIWDSDLESFTIKSNGLRFYLRLQFSPINPKDQEWWCEEGFSPVLVGELDNYCQIIDAAEVAARKQLDIFYDVNHLIPSLKTHALLLALLAKALFYSNVILWRPGEDD